MPLSPICRFILTSPHCATVGVCCEAGAPSSASLAWPCSRRACAGTATAPGLDYTPSRFCRAHHRHGSMTSHCSRFRDIRDRLSCSLLPPASVPACPAIPAYRMSGADVHLAISSLPLPGVSAAVLLPDHGGGGVEPRRLVIICYRSGCGLPYLRK